MSAASDVTAQHLGIEELPSVDLPALLAVAELQRRFDHKYVVPVHRLAELIASLASELQVLEVAGRRSTAYTSVYFDTPELRTYRDHLKQRRRRFKIRTRHYGEPAAAMLEVKCKTGRGETIKYRWAHPGTTPEHLGPTGRHLVGQALRTEYGFDLPDGLDRVATTRFDRVTLLDLRAAERITIDLGLTFDANDRRIQLGVGHAVVETKSARRRGPATAAMASLGLRPDRVSKYCLGIAAAHDRVRGNPWLPVLRRLDPVTAPVA